MDEVARRLLTQSRQEFEDIIVLSKHSESERQILRELRSLVARVHQVNYEDHQKLEQALKGVQSILLSPCLFMTEEGINQRVLTSVGEVLKREQLNFLLMSDSGVGKNNGKTIKENQEIERKIKERAPQTVILRTSFITDFFRLWGPEVSENNRFSLLSGKDKYHAFVNIEDVTQAIKNLSIISDKKHQGQTYTLTGPESLDGPRVVEELKKAVSQKGDIKYVPIQRQQMEQYLRDVREKKRVGGGNHVFEDQPTRLQINYICDVLEWIESGNANIKTDDLKKIINREPQRVEQFFRENANDFQRQVL